MTPRDVLAVLLITAMWLGIFVPLLLEAWRLRCPPASGSRIPREELQAKFEPRIKLLLPLFWVGAGVVSGYVADHPTSVAAAIVFIRILFFLAGGAKGSRIGTMVLHVIELTAGVASGIWLHLSISS